MAAGRLAVRLVVLLDIASALLTRKSQSTCPNSEGLVGYNFSHKGSWANATLVGSGHSKTTCAAACSNLPYCVGFSGQFTDYGKSGTCYSYTIAGNKSASAVDRAFAKCPELVGLAPMTYPELIKMGESMRGQLDKLSAMMSGVDVRMRVLKTDVASAAALLTDGSRKVAELTRETLTNRGGLLAIGRSRESINASLQAINGTQPRIESLLKKLEKTGNKSSKGNSSASSASSAKPLSYYAPNVTALEKTLGELSDPATMKAVDGVISDYKAFQTNVSSAVKLIVRKNLRGLVDTHRDALWNLSAALVPVEKDPCCSSDCK